MRHRRGRGGPVPKLLVRREPDTLTGWLCIGHMLSIGSVLSQPVKSVVHLRSLDRPYIFRSRWIRFFFGSAL